MDERRNLTGLTAQIVSAYVSANQVGADAVGGLIRSVHETLSELSDGAAAPPDPAREPAVSVKKSVTPDYLVCLEDGKKFKSLKRHLRARYGMSPDEYRTKWGLPSDYPMVAPNYAKQRSSLAKKMGLGQPRSGKKS